jgi:hypothetical protein
LSIEQSKTPLRLSLTGVAILNFCSEVTSSAGVHAHAAQQSWAQRLERVHMQAVDRAVNIVNGVIGASARGKGGVRGAAESLEELMHSELAAPDGGRAAQGIAESEDMDVHPQKVIRVASKVSVHRMVQVCNAASLPCQAFVHAARALCSEQYLGKTHP